MVEPRNTSNFIIHVVLQVRFYCNQDDLVQVCIFQLFDHIIISHQNSDLSGLKKDLEPYREFIVPLNKVLEWEQNYYPGILVGVITLLFA